MLTLSTTLSSIVDNNLTLTNAAIAQATQRLASGLRINSAADDPAGLAMSVTLQSGINGLNQGTANANNAVSALNTASTGLTQITQALQSLRTLATQAASSTLSTSDRASLQQQVDQQVAQVNQLIAQTSYNGMTLLDGSAGVRQVQVGANVGQTVALNLSQGISTTTLGAGDVTAGTTLGTFSGLNLNADGTANTSGNSGALTAINVVADGTGGVSFTDQNGQALSSAAVSNLFTTSTSQGVTQVGLASGSALAGGTTTASTLAQVNQTNLPGSVATLSVGSAAAAAQAMVVLGNALASVSALQGRVGASQTLFSGIATTQQAFSTDLSGAQSQILDADTAQETAALSKAQAQQQVDVWLLTQANAQQKLVLQLLQH